MRSHLVVLLVVLLAAGSSGLNAVERQVWTSTPASLKEGKLNGIAVTGDGTMFLAPSIRRLENGGEPAGTRPR